MTDSTKPKLLIKGGQVINDDAMFFADVLVENGVITKVGEDVQVVDGVEVIDASGKMVIPGGIDPHTHMQLPFMGTTAVDDFYEGTKAALAGGTTMIIDFVIPTRDESLLTAYNRWRSWADPKVCCDYGLSVAITGWNENTAGQMEILTKEKGINSFKCFMAYKDALMVRDDELFNIFQECRRLGAIARVHAENGDVIGEKQKQLLNEGVTGPEGHRQSRPEQVEEEATNRACTLACQTNCPLYVVHVMSKGAADVIAEHRMRGAVVFGEATAAGLAIDGSHYFHPCWRHAAAHVMSPPLSLDPNTPDILMHYLASGQLQLTGSDNCTFTSEQKSMGKGDFTKIPNGVNGVEDRLSVVWEKGVRSGKIDAMRFVAITSTIAAKLFNIYPKKGRIEKGADADLVVWDGEAKRRISASTHHQATDMNVFEGMVCHGVPLVTISGGKVVWRDGCLLAERAAGRFLPLSPFSPHAFAVIAQKTKMSAPRKVDRQTADRALTKEEQPKVEQDVAAMKRQPPGGKSSIFI